MSFLNNALKKVKGALSMKTILILITIVLLVGVSYYAYKTYVVPQLNPTYVENREFEKEGESKAELMLFGVSWCPSL